MSAPPLLRVFWPRRLALPQLETARELQLIGHACDHGPVREALVLEVAAAGAAARSGSAAIGTLLFAPPSSGENWSDSAESSGTREGIILVLLPTASPGIPLPVPLPAAASSAQRPPRPVTRRTARQQQQQQGQQHSEEQQFQLVLYDEAALPQLLASFPPGGRTSADQPTSSGQHLRRQRRVRLAARLASRLAGLLLAALLAAYWRGLAASLPAFGSWLARFAAGQLAWFMTAQPAGVKLHRQLCELLSLGGLQYTAALRQLLAGKGRHIAGGSAALLAAAFVVGGLERGLAALELLLWVLSLPLSAPYAAMAAVLSWQLRCTGMMWRVMRGRQQLQPLRQRLARRLAAWRGRAGGGGVDSRGNRAAAVAGPPAQAAAPEPAATAAELVSFSHSPGSGLKQLSGSMLLFMPLLLLLPTTAWFYAAALALHTAASAPQAFVRLCRHLLAAGPQLAALQPGSCRAAAGAGGRGEGAAGGAPGGGRRAVASASGTEGLQFRVLTVEFAGLAALPARLRRAADEATCLAAVPEHGSARHAAAAAAWQAWRACPFAAVHAGAVARAVLSGRPLFLGRPPLRV